MKAAILALTLLLSSAAFAEDSFSGIEEVACKSNEKAQLKQCLVWAKERGIPVVDSLRRDGSGAVVEILHLCEQREDGVRMCAVQVGLFRLAHFGAGTKGKYPAAVWMKYGAFPFVGAARQIDLLLNELGHLLTAERPSA